MRTIIQALCDKSDLDEGRSRELFARIIAGHLSDIEITSVLVALKAKGETPEEIAGAAPAMRQSAQAVDFRGIDVADTCGTGGDCSGTVNLSTAAALVVAEAGVPVAKHGNRSVSSRCGSADILESCGVKIDGTADFAQQCLLDNGLCFLFAPVYHPGMRHAMPVRRALGVRTIFNLLGPLANPAQPKWQVLGVYQPELCLPMAQTLQALGCHAALVVHGSGLDEVAVHGTTHASLLRNGQVSELTIVPENCGVQRHSLDALAGGDAEQNAHWLRNLLAGNGASAHVDAVAINAGALLWVAGRSASIREGAQQAKDILYSGRCSARLQRWTELSHGFGKNSR